MRVLALQPYFERSQIVVYDKLKDLIEEATTFPRGRYDDLIDALAYQLQVYTKPVEDVNIEIDDYEKYLEYRRNGKAAIPPYQYRLKQREEKRYDYN